jgi:hypothetical protein
MLEFGRTPIRKTDKMALKASIKMKKSSKQTENKPDLLEIPGVGPSICQDLEELGIGKVSDLAGKDPEELYTQMCRDRNTRIDRCVLYVFRCAVYYAENEQREPELLKWWNWKNREYKNKKGQS